MKTRMNAAVSKYRPVLAISPVSAATE